MERKKEKKKTYIAIILCVGGHIGDRTTSGISMRGTWPPWGLSLRGEKEGRYGHRYIALTKNYKYHMYK